jgi:two-component system, cell cycle response regulator
MNAWTVRESVVHLLILAAVFILLPACRRRIGAPWWPLAMAMTGLTLVSAIEVRRLFVAYDQLGYDDPELRTFLGIQAAGFLVMLLALVFWVRHVGRSRTELNEIAGTDPLTRLANRREAILLFQHAFSRAKRQIAPLAVILIDLDQFKPINDTQGHLAGDAALKHVAKTLRSRARASDIVSRYGGDEFLVILPNAGKRAALQVAAEFRRALDESTAPFGNQSIRIVASFGVAELDHVHDTSLEDLIARADAAVYAVKNRGGNDVDVWKEVEDPPAVLPTQEVAVGASAAGAASEARTPVSSL